MENNFSAENSLRLISETIERSRRTITKNAGKPLIMLNLLQSIVAKMGKTKRLLKCTLRQLSIIEV